MAAESERSKAEGNGNHQQSGPQCPAMPVLGHKRLYAFIPQEGITTAELAEAVPLIQLAPITMLTKQSTPDADVLYDQLSDGTKRHFAVKEVQNQIIVPRGSMGP